MSNNQEVFKGQTVDFIGMLAGLLCATHCLVSVTAPLLISLLGLGSLFSHTAEIMFILFGVTTAVLTMLFGTSDHAAPKVRIILSLGIIALLSSQYLEIGSDHHEDRHHVSSGSSDETTESNTHDHEAALLKVEAQNHKIDRVHNDNVHETEEQHSIVPIFMSVFGGLFIILGHFYNLRSQRVITHV